MVGWRHWFDTHEFEQVGDGQGRLVCCSPWGCKEPDMTKQLNWTELGGHPTLPLLKPQLSESRDWKNPSLVWAESDSFLNGLSHLTYLFIFKSRLNLLVSKLWEGLTTGWIYQFNSVQFSSVAQSCLTLGNPMDCSTPGFPITNSQSLLKLMSIDSAIQPSHPLTFPSPLAFPSIRVFSNESALRIRWPKCWSFSFNISPSNEYSGLISLGIDWFDLLAVQGTLKSLLQHFKSINSLALSFLYSSALTYKSTGKTIALAIWTFVGKVIFLLFNMLSAF